MMGSVCGALERVKIFSYLKVEFEGILKQKEHFDPSFCWKLCRLWSCLLIRTHGSEITIPGDS